MVGDLPRGHVWPEGSGRGCAWKGSRQAGSRGGGARPQRNELRPRLLSAARRALSAGTEVEGSSEGLTG